VFEGYAAHSEEALKLLRVPLLHLAARRNDELQVAAYLAQLRQQQQQQALLAVDAAPSAAGCGVVAPAGAAAVLQRAFNSSSSGCGTSSALAVMHGV
jgi:hypothetical protein